MARITLTVLVKETYRNRFSVVVDDCRRQGMAVEREMTAWACSRAISRLKK
ncbi:hypothetical protein [Advenella kashmirensis]|uniref:hypothetical protein n=1 Tax=Advenella kashmirensis TaxID=310575 RepID=UPI001493E6BC|nr:hypothetical protein [Advenella kashmirensis]